MSTREFASFVLGLVLGVPLVIFGITAFADNVTVLITILLVILTSAILFFLLVFLNRKRIFESITGFAEAKFDDLSKPALETLKHAIELDKDKAFESADRLLRIVATWLGWLIGQTWMIGIAITLLSVFATLVGSALIFQQNKILVNQNELIGLQNGQLEIQTSLVDASQRATQAIEVSKILDLVGDELKRQDGNENIRIPKYLLRRIRAVSRSLKPYYYLGEDGELNDIALSPERGMLMAVLVESGLPMGESLFRLDFRNADLIGAKLTNVDFGYFELQNASFENADLSFSKLRFGNFDMVDFSNANLEGAVLDNGLGPTSFVNANFGGAKLEGAVVDSADWIENSRAKLDSNWRIARNEDNAFILTEVPN